MERRRLGDRRPKNSTEAETESASPLEPGELIASPATAGPGAAVLPADNEQRLPEPIPIHRRSNRANAAESGNRSRTWTGSSPRAEIPGLSEDELRVLEPSRGAFRAGRGGGVRRWPVSRGIAGHGVDLALADELSAVVRELLFCANSGQLLHGFALYSDSFLFRTMDDSGLSEEEFKAAHQHVAAKPIRDWTRLAELREIERHADNVATATVVYTPPAGVSDAPREKFRFLKNEETGAWMIDDIEPMD
jgi:hypothetical protein